MSRRVVALVVSLLFALQALANNPPETERGFKPEMVYQFNGFDSVNLYNGNLNLTIPLASYPVSADVSYSFVLRYAGNVWEYVRDCVESGPGDPNPPPCEPKWRQHYNDNAGLGWSIHFGRLRYGHSFYGQTLPNNSFVYTSPDGSDHNFYETLHEPKCSTTGQTCEASAPTTCDCVVPGIWYTRDGTYIRLRDLGGYKLLEFANGERHLFSSSGNSHTLTYIYGASSQLGADGITPVTNYVRFTAQTRSTPNGDVTDSIILDSHGRRHEILYQRESGGLFAVDKIRVAAPGGGTTQTYADYNLTYNDYTIVSGQPVDGPLIDIMKPCNGDGEVNYATRFLTRFDMPHGEKWLFRYENPNQCEGAGTLRRATLPTGGNIHWAYSSYPGTWPSGPHGVKERCLRRDDSPCSVADNDADQDEYMSYELVPNSGQPFTVLVDTWVRNSANSWARDSRVKHHFAGNYSDAAGLPIGADTDGTAMARNISTETFDCLPDSNWCYPSPSRKTFVKYEMDFISYEVCSIDYPCWRERNRRVKSERTEYLDDSIGSSFVWANTNYTLFDGLGHYREVKTEGNFNYGNARESFTAYNANTYNYNPATWTGSTVGNYILTSTGGRESGFRMLRSTDSWILNTFTTSYMRENNETSHAEACFDPTTGFLARKRLKSHSFGTAQSGDILNVFERDSVSGYPSSEQTYGGDYQAVPTTALCTLTPPQANEYSSRIDHTYEYGARKTSKFSGMTWFSRNNTIDRWTGLTTASTDPSGMTTNYSYDNLRRLVFLIPPGVSLTSYQYTAAGTGTPARVKSTTGSGLLSVQQEWEFDPYGRITLEKRLLPSEQWSAVRTEFDSAGRRKSVSEAGLGSPSAHKTTYSDYDPFGRPTTITAADGKWTTFVHLGERITRRSYQVAKPTGDATVTIEEERDRQGRLTKVIEDTTGTPVTTEYGYDEANRLGTVKIWNGSTSQDRTFSYDRRGLLTSEAHPESGSTSYLYDSRGLVVQKTTPVATLTHAYDGAGRLTSVSQTNVGTLKFFQYDRANSGSDYARGKLDYGIRYNRSTELGTVEVKERLTYAGPGGRMSRKDTTVTRPGETINFFDTYEYNSVGDLWKIGYPGCSSGCGSLVAPSRTITTTYKHGLVTDVEPYTVGWTAFIEEDGIGYHPNGMVDFIQHRNVNGGWGPRQTYTIANGIARIDSITVTNFCDGGNLSVSAPSPQSSTINTGQTTSVSVSASGATSYQWYQVSGNSIVPVSNQSDPLLDVTLTQAGTYTYFCRVGNGVCTLDSQTATVTVSACSNPNANITAPSTATASSPVTALVAATSGATYVWSVSNGTITSGQGTSQISATPGCSGTMTINVTVTVNGCQGSDSHNVAINGPTVTIGGTTTINQGQSTSITATLTGTGPWVVTWADQPSNPVTVNPPQSSTSRNVSPNGTTTYTATARDTANCTAQVIGSATVTVNLPTPANVTATAAAANQVNVSWTYSGTAESFRIYRAGAHISTRTMPGSLTFTDNGVAAGTAYVYHVVAVHGASTSGFSVPDLATTIFFTDDPLVSGTFIKAVHINELQAAVNAVRAAGGSPPYGFTNVSAGMIVTAAQLQQIRTVLDAARQQLVLPAIGYARPTLQQGMLILGTDITDTRGGIK